MLRHMLKIKILFGIMNLQNIRCKEYITTLLFTHPIRQSVMYLKIVVNNISIKEVVLI